MLNQKNQTCHMKHFCERESFNRKRQLYTDGSYRESRYEVWDPCYQGGPDEVPDEVLVYEAESKEECEAYMATQGKALELRENGVCQVCDLYEKRQAHLREGRVDPFYLVVSGTSRHYGGPEEGGWWYNWTEILEVRRAFTFQEGLRQARELRDKYPQPKYDIYSCANDGEPNTEITLCYGEADPRWPHESTERPRYE